MGYAMMGVMIADPSFMSQTCLDFVRPEVYTFVSFKPKRYQDILAIVL